MILIQVLVVQAGYQLQQKAPAREDLEFTEVTDIFLKFGLVVIESIQIMSNHDEQIEAISLSEISPKLRSSLSEIRASASENHSSGFKIEFMHNPNFYEQRD